VTDDLRLRHGSGPKPSSTNYPVTLCHIPPEHPQLNSCESFRNTQFRYCPSLFGIPIGLLMHGGLAGLPGNQAVKAADRVVDINRYPTISVCWGCRRWCTYTIYLIFLRKFTVSCVQTWWCTFYRFRYFVCGFLIYLTMVKSLII
jgi:hypothetical protein